MKKVLFQAPGRAVRLSIMLTALSALQFACSTARMPVSESLDAVEPMLVTGRQAQKIKTSLSFGPFEAVEIDRSWVKGSDVQKGAFEAGRRSQRFTFLLRDQGIDRWFVSCEASLQRSAVNTEVVDVEIQNRSKATCYLTPQPDLSITWILALSERGDRPLEGELTNKAITLAVTGTRKLKGGLPSQTETGFEFRKDERVVAAVEVINRGAVWLSEDTTVDRDVLAAAMAALLLLEDLRAHLPEYLSGIPSLMTPLIAENP